MTNKTKKWLVIALSLIILGGLIFVTTMTFLSWDFSKLSVNSYVTNPYDISEHFTSISIETKNADIVFEKSNDSTSKVVCYEQEKLRHSVLVEDGTLTIKVVDERKWYDYIEIGVVSPKITITIPQGAYDTLKIDGSTSDIKLGEDFSFNNIDITVSTGDICLENTTAKAINLKTTTGDISVKNASCNSLAVDVSTGDILLKEVNCKMLTSTGSTGDIELVKVIATDSIVIERTTGDVMIEDSDANDIVIKTSTGDVNGSLCSDKIFDVKTTSGDKNVPTSAVGGSCKITTTTGDVKITINK